MHLLHLIYTLNPDTGGLVTALYSLVEELEEQGVQNTIACLDDPREAFLKEAPIRVQAMGPGFRSYGYTRKWAKGLSKILPEVDVAVIHGLWQYHGVGSLGPLKKSSTPFYMFPHGMLDPRIKKLYPSKHQKKRLYFHFFERRLFQQARGIFFTAQMELDSADEAFPVPKQNGTVVGMGCIPPEKAPSELAEAFLSKHPELLDRRVCLFLSRLHPKKAPDLLIQAWRSLSETWRQQERPVTLALIGPSDPDYLEQLETLAGDSLSTRPEPGPSGEIRFYPPLSGDLKWGALAAAELMALPSHQENFGMVVAEALAMHTPVLISREVHIFGEVQNHHGGIIVEDTVSGIREGLTDWASRRNFHDEPARRNAQNTFQSCFQMDGVAKRLIESLKPSAQPAP